MKNVNFGKGEQVTLFSSLAIEIASRCNRHCFFCPNAYFDRVDKFMDELMVRKMLLELQALNYKGRLEWYIYNEPTRDPRLLDYIQLARTLVPRCCQMVNTNGDFFHSASDVKKYFDAGLNQMQINVYSASDSHPDPKQFQRGIEVSQKREQLFGTWVKALELSTDVSLYQNIGPKARAVKVVKKYGISPNVSDGDVEGPNHFSNRSGSIPGFRSSLKEPIKKMCVRPFRFLNINFNGDGILCCNDYYGKKTFGNIADKTLIEIWNTEELHHYRLKLKNKDRNSFLCDVCDFNGGYYPHMIDTLTAGSKVKDSKIIQSYISEDSIKSMPLQDQGKPLFPIVGQPQKTGKLF